MADFVLRLCSTLAGWTERLSSSILSLLFNPASALAIVLVTPLVTQLSLIVQTNVATCATGCVTRTAMKILIRLEGGKACTVVVVFTKSFPSDDFHRLDLCIQLPTPHNSPVLKWVLSFQIDLSAATCVKGVGSTSNVPSKTTGRQD